MLREQGKKIIFCNAEDDAVYQKSMDTIREKNRAKAQRLSSKAGVVSGEEMAQLAETGLETINKRSDIIFIADQIHLHIDFSSSLVFLGIDKDLKCLPMKRTLQDRVVHELKHFHQDGQQDQLGFVEEEQVLTLKYKAQGKIYVPPIIEAVFPKELLKVQQLDAGEQYVLPVETFKNGGEFNAMTGFSVTPEGKIYLDPISEWAYQYIETGIIRGAHFVLTAQPVSPFPELYYFFIKVIAPQLPKLLEMAYETEEEDKK